jgi:LysM repeat protein
MNTDLLENSEGSIRRRMLNMRKAAFAALLIVAVFLTAGNATALAQAEQGNIKIKSGDTLTKIARRHDTTYRRLFYANTKIKNPDLIYARDKIRVPRSDEKLKTRPLSTETDNNKKKTAAPVSKPNQNSPASTPKQQVRRAPAKPAQPRPDAVAPKSISAGVWDRLAQCEASGNWSINTGNGYYGGLQFSLSSWRYVGGTGYPHQASKVEQIKRAEMLLAKQGWNAWPACSAKLGLR